MLKERIGDITDAASIRKAVAGHDVVVHAAAITAYLGGAQDAQQLVNVEGTRNVAESCRIQGVRQLLHVSSVAAVGIPTDPSCPANEDFDFNLEGSGLTYHITKWRAEAENLRRIDDHSIESCFDLL
jgi:dihydroflavonol-4-reductase